MKNHCGNKEADSVLGHVAADTEELCLPSQWAVSEGRAVRNELKGPCQKEQPKCPSPDEQTHKMW